MQKKIQTADIIFLLLLFVITGSVLLTRSPYNVPTPPRDSGIFIQIGSQILDGKILYRDMWDNKQPLIYFFNAVGLWLGGGSIWGVWGLETALLMILVLGTYWLLRKSNRPFPSFSITALCFLAIVQLMSMNYTEEYALPFQMGILAIMLLAYLPGRRRSLASFGMGILAGIVFCIKPTFVDVAVSSVLLMMLIGWIRNHGKLIRHLLMFGLGFALVNGVMFLYFWLNGALRDYIESAFLFGAYYAKPGLGQILHSLLEVLEFQYYAPILFILVCLWLTAIIIFLVSLRAVFKQDVRSFLTAINWENSFLPPILFLGIVDFPLVLTTIALSGRNFTHYYVSLFPVLVLLFGAAVIYIEQLLTHLPRKTIFNEILAAVLIFGAYVPILQTVTYLAEPGEPDTRAEVAEYIQENTQAGEKVLVWGWESIIYFLAQREPSTKYAIQYPAYFASRFRQDALQTLLSDLSDQPPIFIVDTMDQEMPLLEGKPVQECLEANPAEDGNTLQAIRRLICSRYQLVEIISPYYIYQLDPLLQ